MIYKCDIKLPVNRLFQKHDIPLAESFQLFVNSYFTRSKLVWTVIPCSRQDNRTQEFQAAAISSSS
jgi:hypothetical protein